MKIFLHLSKFLRDRSGATALEYALMLGLMTLVLVVGLTAAGQEISLTWNTVATQVQTATQAAAA